MEVCNYVYLLSNRIKNTRVYNELVLIFPLKTLGDYNNLIIDCVKQCGTLSRTFPSKIFGAGNISSL